MLFDPTQDLGAVDLAQHHVGHAHRCHGVEHPPTVAVEHRKGVQVDVAVGDTGVPTEGDRVQPPGPMGLLDTLGPGGGARGVVDRCDGVLVGLPRCGLAVVPEPLGVGFLAEDPLSLTRHVGEQVGQLGIDEQRLGPAVLDDVGDLVARQAEVDRHEDPAVAAHPEERGEEPGRVVRHHGHPGPHRDSHRVHGHAHLARHVGELAVGHRGHRRCGLIGLVDHGHPFGVHRRCPIEEVVDRQRNLHACIPSRFGPGSGRKCVRS